MSTDARGRGTGGNRTARVGEGKGTAGVRARTGAGAGTGAGSLPAAAPRASLYDEVTARIVAELEAGRMPWVQPWGAAGAPGRSGATAPGGTGQGSDDAQHRWNAGVGLPRNALTARSYSGINVLILWGAVIEQGYPSQAWLTFKQAITAGGAVRKGERGTTIVYADRFVPRQQRDAAIRGIASPGSGDTAKALETGESARTVAFLKRFTVFNVAQCEGLRPGLAPEPVPLPEREIVPVAEDVIAASGVTFHVGGDQAFYMPSRDVVQVPPQPAFHDQINFYRTVLHELTHATGHPSRLDRKLVTAFGTKDYAREELVAEMGSAFLCAALGIVPTVRHADYLASWLDVLREDNRAIFRAASAASKAADWLLARRSCAGDVRASEAAEAERLGVAP